MIRKTSIKRTTIEPVSAGSTVGKSRRKYVGDCIDLADLGCHAFKVGTIPAGRRVMSHNLSSNVRVTH